MRKLSKKSRQQLLLEQQVSASANGAYVFGEARIWPMRQVILAETTEEKQVALSQLKTFQLNDFKELLLQTKEQKCVIRLLDPPLHEFYRDHKNMKKWPSAAAIL